MKTEKGDVKSELFNQILNETVAMAKYAVSSGMKIPGKTLDIIDAAIFEKKVPEQISEETNKGVSSDTDVKVPKKLAVKTSIDNLAYAHSVLSELIAPAKPQTILLLATERAKKRLFQFLGPIPLVRQMMLAALVFLVAFILIGLSSKVNTNIDAGNILKSSGLDLLVNELFFLAAAGIGASFAALYKINRYVVEGTYDPKYISSYWIRFVLGLIAGLILAELLPLETGEIASASFSKPLLALIGGFSASVVFRILNRMVRAVESLVKGDISEEIKSQRMHMESVYNEKQTKDKMKYVKELMNLQTEIDESGKPEDIKNKVNSILNKFLPEGDISSGEKS